MNIDKDILIKSGAVLKKYMNGNIIFFEKEEANFYYQIVTGKVKIVNINEDGKEFMQGIFSAGNSFGEPPMLIGKPYPSSAISVGESSILKLRRDSFINLLDENQDLCKSFLFVLSKRIYNKSNSASNLINHPPEYKILGFLTSEKAKVSLSNDRILIALTRQEIANFTGLRVETVIRTIKKMKETNKLDVIDRKIYF